MENLEWRELWNQKEQARLTLECEELRNVSGLPGDERFAAHVALRRAQQAFFEADIALRDYEESALGIARLI